MRCCSPGVFTAARDRSVIMNESSLVSYGGAFFLGVLGVYLVVRGVGAIKMGRIGLKEKYGPYRELTGASARFQGVLFVAFGLFVIGLLVWLGVRGRGGLWCGSVLLFCLMYLSISDTRSLSIN